ncbi:hypothetical protein D8674_018577 [Pyrus ussuriensis x Pyrus communis]|uniref:Uncharacterized protein n=1 Tax=Pyrus ussuriensis x Pyrus communis TaxID=2448454 RepID=A0A5N5G574_9ROSA|nr:hypothetical protein D8674_018577 [Pyrus ussuriensis x Pyrus communis]
MISQNMTTQQGETQIFKVWVILNVMAMKNQQSNKLELNSIVDQTRTLGKEKYFDY